MRGNNSGSCRMRGWGLFFFVDHRKSRGDSADSMWVNPTFRECGHSCTVRCNFVIAVACGGEVTGLTIEPVMVGNNVFSGLSSSYYGGGLD